MSKVTQEMLAQALQAWATARETALHEHEAMNVLIKSHASLIESMRLNGHTWGQSEDEFKKLSSAHQEAILSAYKNLDARGKEYKNLLAKFSSKS